MTVDPLDLIRDPSRLPANFRCSRCGARHVAVERLPTGGVECAVCHERIHITDQFEYAGLKARIVAVLADAATLFVPLAVFESTFEFQYGHPTHRAALLFAFRALVGAMIVVFIWAGEAIGQTYGKRFAGMRVVRASNWGRPGPLLGLARAAAKVITIATFGIGYAMIAFDPERRALHDRLCGTRVVEAAVKPYHVS